MVEKASNLKITVLRRLKPEDVFKEKPIDYPDIDACDLYKDGQEFIVDESCRMPDGFCSWAWNDIYKNIVALGFYGNFQWFNEEGVSVID